MYIRRDQMVAAARATLRAPMNPRWSTRQACRGAAWTRWVRRAREGQARRPRGRRPV